LCYSHNSEGLHDNISMQRKRTYEYKLVQVDKVADELSEVIDSKQIYQLYMLYSKLNELDNSVVYSMNISLKKMITFNSYLVT